MKLVVAETKDQAAFSIKGFLKQLGKDSIVSLQSLSLVKFDEFHLEPYNEFDFLVLELSTPELKKRCEIYSKYWPHKPVIIICDFSKCSLSENEFLKTWILKNPNVVLVFDKNWPKEFFITVVQHIVLSAQRTNMSDPILMDQDVFSLHKELEELSKNIKVELGRVKKLHQQIVPNRIFESKGIKIFSKYSAGQSEGGEFVDIFERKSKVYLILSHVLRYVDSSFIVDKFIKFRQLKELNAQLLESFSLELGEQIRTENGANLFIAEIDLIEHRICGYNFGKAVMLEGSHFVVGENAFQIDKSFLDKAYFSFQFERLKKYFLLSPGLRKNTHDHVDGKSIVKIIAENINKSNQEIINELFFQIKKDTDDGFLNFDSTVLSIEVSTHAIFKV